MGVLPETCNRSTHNMSAPIEPHGTPPFVGMRPTPEQLIATENGIRDLWNAGEVNALTHLSGSVDGEYEKWLCRFFERNISPNDWVLCSHRAHYHYQLHGGVGLIERIRAGKSMFCYHPRFIQSAIVAGCASIAVGLALAIQRRGGDEKVWCFSGDGAADHGHFLETVAFTANKKLPLTFIVEDNDSSCGVTKVERRGGDWEWGWPTCVVHYRYKLKWPHGGTGEKIKIKCESRVGA